MTALQPHDLKVDPPAPLNWVVLETASRGHVWQIAAAFSTPIAASNYCMWRKHGATNPYFDCLWTERSRLTLPEPVGAL